MTTCQTPRILAPFGSLRTPNASPLRGDHHAILFSGRTTIPTHPRRTTAITAAPPDRRFQGDKVESRG
ncbi:MAG: hypothetical protein KDA96_24695 [Planctomycetaceae bacterium]|nr:hypothetical protein [Planctomycetaceae bacterium]